MRIELTVESGGRRADVCVDAPPSAALSAALSGLAAAVGASAGAPLWCGDDLLAAETPLDDPRLRTGALLSFNGRAGAPPPALLALHVVGGPGAGLVVPLARGRTTLGRDAGNDVVLPDAAVSRCHAAVDVGIRALTLRDLGSTNGTRLDGRLVPPGGVPLRIGALVALGDTLLCLAGPADPPASVRRAPDGRLLVHRAPRPRATSSDDVISLPVRRSPPQPGRVQWVAALLPAAVAGLVAWLAHMPQFLLFALLSPVLMLSAAAGDRAHWRRSRRREAAAFALRLAEARGRIAEGLDAETASRRSAAPDPAAVLLLTALPTGRLWERDRADPDLLRVRIGTTELPSTLAVRDGAHVAPAGRLSSVPMCVDLRRGPLGVAGPVPAAIAVGRWLVGQLAALHSPSDVTLALLLDPAAEQRWTWTRWLPHQTEVATGPQAGAALVADLLALVERRRAACSTVTAGWTGPWTVLLVDPARSAADMPGFAELVAAGAAVGVTAVCFDTDPQVLPAACATIARSAGPEAGRLSANTADGSTGNAVSDQVSAEWAEQVARNLAPLVDAGSSGRAALPAEVALFDPLIGRRLADPSSVLARWDASPGGARTALGRTAGGVLDIDLATDGPHALVAGTTGSGKSELLRALVTGLAVHQPPDALTLLLVDYKGGAAFAECARLPHTAGMVTDLDPHLTERALRSLRGELRRRERLFAAAGAAGLSAYRATGSGEPVPRLVIVIDEFATLAEEHPRFLRGLIDVAQRGRSLGVHLVLATQRAGSAVSAEIRANTSLRVALRVTDPSESTAVIDSPVAAAIERSEPGRGYLRSGTTLTCFQAPLTSAVTAPVPTGVAVRPLDAWRRSAPESVDGCDRTDLARLVDLVREAGRLRGFGQARSPWVPPLPELLPHQDLPEPPGRATVALARVDLPDEQRYGTLDIDLGRGASLLVAGCSGSGRTGALLALAIAAAQRLSPDELHLHAVDASGALADALRLLPHCATVLGPADLALVPRLFARLEQQAVHLLAEAGARRPTRLILVDGWDALCAALPDSDALACTEGLARLLRTGPATALSVVVTGDRSVLAPAFAAGFAERLLLRFGDTEVYARAGLGPRQVPPDLPPGRGVRASDAALVQVAAAAGAADGGAVREAVADAAARWAAVSRSPRSDAVRIHPLPRRVRVDELCAVIGRLTLGVAGDGAVPVAFDPFEGCGRLLVAGPPRSGRSSVLQLLAEQARAAGIPTVVAAPAGSPLATPTAGPWQRMIRPADPPGPPPTQPTLVLVDDAEAFADGPSAEALVTWMHGGSAPLAVVLAGRTDTLATTFRGPAAEVVRSRCGILLRPGPVDGELLGVRLAGGTGAGPPGRGIAVGEAHWGELFAVGGPVPIQMAMP